MTDAAQLLKLMSWLSPVFPTGGFAYSSGLEQAAAQAIIRDKVALEDWIAAQLAHGGSWNDAVLLMEAHRRVSGSNRACELAALAELATALPTSQQRLNETCDQGTSFLKAAAHWIDGGQLPGRDTPLPVAIGAVAGLERIDPRLATTAPFASALAGRSAPARRR
jgi:urease accessory protein